MQQHSRWVKLFRGRGSALLGVLSAYQTRQNLTSTMLDAARSTESNLRRCRSNRPALQAEWSRVGNAPDAHETQVQRQLRAHQAQRDCLQLLRRPDVLLQRRRPRPQLQYRGIALGFRILKSNCRTP